MSDMELPQESKKKRNVSLSGANNPFYGKHHTEETKLKLSKIRKEKYTGINHPMYNRPVSEETRKKMSESGKVKVFTEEHKKNISISSIGRRKGIHPSEETKQKMRENHKNSWNEESKKKLSNTLKGRKLTEEHKKKISLALTGIDHSGSKNSMYGKHHSEESKLKNKLSRTGKCAGSNHPNWKNGISNQPYPFEFNHALKELIRSKYNYECQLCNCKQSDIMLDVHHIDYNKTNLKINNLIPLCHSCHTKTNFNREYYTKYFSELSEATRANEHKVRTIIKSMIHDGWVTENASSED